MSFARLVKIPRTLEAVPRDPDDNAVIECAIADKATYVISGDRDLLDLKQFQNFEIVHASEFLDILAKQI